MKYPSLIKKSVCKTSAKITIYSEELNEDGAPQVIFEGEFLCNYQSKAKTIYTKDKSAVTVNGVLLIPGDIAPDCPVISNGFVEIYGKKRDIVCGTKARNPDSTVNYTKIDIM